jgi:hypothetical protein
MFDILVAAVIAMSHPQAPADTTTVTVPEDDPAFDCRTMGNLRCGIGNDQGVEPGDYSQR